MKLATLGSLASRALSRGGARTARSLTLTPTAPTHQLLHLASASASASAFTAPSRRALSTVTGVETRPEAQCAEKLTQIGTRNIFTYEHDQYRELCRRFYEEVRTTNDERVCFSVSLVPVPLSACLSVSVALTPCPVPRTGRHSVPR